MDIRRTAEHLLVDLPIGSKEGNYDLALLSTTGDEVSHAAATAKLEDHIVILRADVDFVNVRPGPYFLVVRQPGLGWTRFPARVASIAKSSVWATEPNRRLSSRLGGNLWILLVHNDSSGIALVTGAPTSIEDCCGK